jgi:hypothetical protein
VSLTATGFFGGAIVGGVLYSARIGDVMRFDLAAGTGTLESFASLGLPTELLFGVVFDGHYLTFPPYLVGGPDGPVALRYDTTAQFGQIASWEKSVPPPVGSRLLSYAGGASDGTYVYFAPILEGVNDQALLLRHRIDGALAAPAEWQALDLTTIDPSWTSFGAMAFDGRFVYLLRSGAARLARFDTTKELDAGGAAWGGLDLTSLGVSGFFVSMTFDGEWLYAVPATGNRFVRFHARTPRAPPRPETWSP